MLAWSRLRSVELPGRVFSPTELFSGLRPRPAQVPRFNPTGIRHASLEAGENKTGHISTAPNVSILFFDNVFPLKLQWFTRLPWSTSESVPNVFRRLQASHGNAHDPVNILSKTNLDKADIHVVELLPRVKEGGAYVKFTHDEMSSAQDIETAIRGYLKDNPVKPWWNPFQRMHTRLVKGRPWVEDLYRLPSPRLKIEFLPTAPGAEVAELSQEQLYSFFRPYGKILDIMPQPADSKVLPKFATIDFQGARRAIMAKNCLHGYVVGEVEGGGRAGTMLRIGYEQKIKVHWIRDWLVNHPRIVIPAFAAIAAGITVAIFDPVRTFFIKIHVTRAFHLTDNRIYRWFKAQATDIFTFRRRAGDDIGMKAIWEDRASNIEQLKNWLLETADTFIIVQGPRGSGQRDLVDEAVKSRKNKLVIDCKPIQEARGESATICAAAAEVGYRPVFSWMNSISGMIDLAAQSAAGVKTGFSETLDAQLSKIWTNTATALKQIALSYRRKDDKDAYLSDDEWLEAHPEKRAVVIVDNFLHKAQDDGIVYDKIAEWAARLTTANIAHVIFLTTNLSFSKSLSRALPGRVFRQISLSDCSPEVAKRFVVTHLEEVNNPSDADDPETKALTPRQRRKDLKELDECIPALGGRLTELGFLVRRMKAGESPKKAVDEIIKQSASEIMKMYLVPSEERKWTSEQAWMLIKCLGSIPEGETLRYNEVLLDDAFKSGGDAVLQALEQAELISIVSSANGRPQAIKPGKPVYQPAFKRLSDDQVLRSKLDLAILTNQIKSANGDIDKYETELKLLGALPRQPKEVIGRIRYLLTKLEASHLKVELWEKQSGDLKVVLQQQY